MIDYQQELNASQCDAVLYTDGNCMVIAGAGSGKTRVLTYRIAHLLEEGVEPWSILALTFTNKAAGEMKQRIAARVGENRARYLWMGTFHSIFSRILRSEAAYIGYTPNFTIYDQQDSQNLIKSIVKDMQLDDKTYKANVVQNRISNAKNRLITASAYIQNADIYKSDQFKRIPMVGKIYERYEQRCRQSDAMDFDDLLLNTFILFRDNPDVLERYGTSFKHILVDEYQDTNYAQHCIVWQLTRNGAKVCVVGDDAQSIYSFRGANLDNMLKFSKLYPDSKLFKLEQNYRSTQTIVEAAGSLICKNHAQIPKNVFSENEPGDKIKVLCAHSDLEESEMVVNRLLDLHTFKDVPWREMAILYRTNAQSRPLEEALRKRGLPYKIYGGLSFYQRKEIKDVIAYFRLIANPNDEEAFKRIINYPARGIGDTTVGKIILTAQRYGVSLWQVIKEPVLFPMDVSKGTMTKIQNFRELIEGWIARLQTEDAYTLGHDVIMSSGMSKDIYSGRNPEDISRQENLEEFLSGMQDFVESRREEDMGDEVYLPDFLQEVALLTDLDSDEGDSNDKVVLMTIHSAKGLEFPTVFVVGLEENIFPSPMCTNSMRELEEERRLLYVAITRAEKHCILTCAQNRFRYGRMEYDTPSRFIRDIDPELLEVQGEAGGGDTPFGSAGRKAYNRYDGGAYGTGKTGGYSRSSRYESEGPEWMQNPRPVASQFKADPKPRAVAPRQPEKPVNPFGANFKRVYNAVAPRPMASDPSASDLREGARIEHQRFGVGTVVRIEGTGENTKATVEFRNAGTKQLLLKFAKFKIIG